MPTCITPRATLAGLVNSLGPRIGDKQSPLVFLSHFPLHVSAPRKHRHNFGMARLGIIRLEVSVGVDTGVFFALDGFQGNLWILAYLVMCAFGLDSIARRFELRSGMGCERYGFDLSAVGLV